MLILNYPFSVYLQNKFDNIKSVIDIVNTKCYCERRKLWGKNTETVRKPLPKNSKKQTDDMGKDKKDMDQDKRKKKNKGTSSKRSEKKKDGKYRHMTDSASETVKQFRKSKCWNSPLKPSNNRQLKPTKSRSKKNLKEAGAFKPKPRPQFGGKRPKLLDVSLLSLLRI